MSRGNHQHAYGLWARYISHLWRVVRIQETAAGLRLTMDSTKSIDTHRKGQTDYYELAESTMRLYLQEWGVMRIEGQAKEFLIRKGMATQAEFDHVDEIMGKGRNTEKLDKA